MNENLLKISGLKYGDDLFSEQNKITKFPAIVELENNSYQITNNGTVTPIKPQPIGNLTKNNYGDYIDLGQSVVGNEKSTADDWRILYNDKNGNIYAILADYLPNNNDAITRAGFGNNINGTYNIYSSTSSSNLLERLNNDSAWQILIPEDLRTSCKVKGASTVEILMASYNEKYNVNPPKGYPDTLNIDNDSSKEADTFYTLHPGTGVYTGCIGFWLASINAGSFLFVNAGGVGIISFQDQRCGCRPVVSIPSNIKVTSSISDETTVWKVIQ